VTERSHDGVEHEVQLLTHIFRKEAQYQVAVLLKQLILATVAAVGDRIREMLGAVQLHRHTRIGAQQIDFKLSETIECDRQRDVEAETSLGLRQRLQSPVEERFRRTARSICALGVWRYRPRKSDRKSSILAVDEDCRWTDAWSRLMAIGFMPQMSTLSETSSKVRPGSSVTSMRRRP
jgi:hypothetical protein